MSDPFLIEGPAIISFSGGRTSGMLLKKCIDARNGALHEDTRVIFTNTGKEFPRTLDFIEECSQRWSVEIIWLERRQGGRVERVTHATASRKGEPFEELITDRKYLPNPVARLCTQHLKIATMQRWVTGVLGWDYWTSVIGFRADEQHRRGGQSKHWDVVAPLRDAGITRDRVMSFWRLQPFDLGLKPWESNCDLCFLKGSDKRERVIRDHPETPDQWIRWEHTVADTTGKFVPFRSSGPSYETLKRRASLPMLRLDDPGDGVDDLGDCTCTD